MKRCPACGNEFGDDFQFCSLDGTRLIEGAAPEPGPTPTAPTPTADPELDALLQEVGWPPAGAPGTPVGAPAVARPVEAPSVPGGTAGRRCPTCGTVYGPSQMFCTLDGTPLGGAEVAPDVAPVEGGTGAPPPSGRPWQRAALWGGLAVLVLLAAVGTAYLLTRPPALEGEALAALTRGDVVTPEGTSAYDLYRRLKAEDPGSASLDRIGGQAMPVLLREIDAFYTRWYQTSEADAAEWPGVLRRCEWATEIAPDDAELQARLQYTRGRVAYEDGRYDEAVGAYQAAIAAWPEWALPYNSLGVLYTQPGARDYREAARWYQQAVERDARWAYPYQNLGSVLVELRRDEEARQALEQALALNEALPRAHFLLAVVYARQGRFSDAASEGERALALAPYGGERSFDASRLRRLVGEWQQEAYYYYEYEGD